MDEQYYLSYLNYVLRNGNVKEIFTNSLDKINRNIFGGGITNPEKDIGLWNIAFFLRHGLDPNTYIGDELIFLDFFQKFDKNTIANLFLKSGLNVDLPVNKVHKLYSVSDLLDEYDIEEDPLIEIMLDKPSGPEIEIFELIRMNCLKILKTYPIHVFTDVNLYQAIDFYASEIFYYFLRIGLRPNYIILNYISNKLKNDDYFSINIKQTLGKFSIQVDEFQRLSHEMPEIENDMKLPESFIRSVDHSQFSKMSDYIKSRSEEDSLLDLYAYRKHEGFYDVTHPDLETCTIKQDGIFWSFSVENYNEIIENRKNPFTKGKISDENWNKIKDRERIMRRTGFIKKKFSKKETNFLDDRITISFMNEFLEDMDMNFDEMNHDHAMKTFNIILNILSKSRPEKIIAFHSKLNSL